MSNSEQATELSSKLKQLDQERRLIEDEIVTLCDLLNQPGMPGMKGNLVDAEGFPRADIDLTQVQSMRGRVACLNTDLSAKMKEIESMLTNLHRLTA